MNIKRFRRIQTISSVLLFIGVFFLCWYVTKFNLMNIQLSFWGVDKDLGWIWNSCVSILAVSIFVNVFYFIKHHTRLHDKYTLFLKRMFLLTSIFLLITGAVDMSHSIHTITAYFYFFCYPLSVFLFAHLNRKHMQYREWLTHTIFAVSMGALTLLTLKVFPGMAIPEIIHTSIVIGWNMWILVDYNTESK